MGAWGPGLFSDDTTCEVRDEYVASLRRGTTDSKAEAAILERFRDLFRHHEIKCLVYFALAATQCRHGRLSPRVKKETLGLIEAGGDLDVWERDSPSNVPARRRALKALEKQVSGPQKARSTVKVVVPKEKKKRADLPHGTIFGMPLPGGTWAALMLIGHSDFGYQTLEPCFRLLDWSARAPPTPEQLKKRPARFVDLYGAQGIQGIHFMKENRENPIERLVQIDLVLPAPADEPRSEMWATSVAIATEVRKTLDGKAR